jgi:hypothetical protein
MCMSSIWPPVTDPHSSGTSARSTAQPSTLDPVWNEIWHVKNVPPGAALFFEFFDKDEGAIKDDYIGKVSTTIESGSKHLEILGRTKSPKGSFSLNVRQTLFLSLFHDNRLCRSLQTQPSLPTIPRHIRLMAPSDIHAINLLLWAN